MKKLFVYQLLLSFSLIAATSSSAQVRTKVYKDAIPSDFAKNIEKFRFIEIEPPQEFIKKIGQNDVSKSIDNKFAVSAPANINLLSEGTITNKGEYTYYSVKIIAKNALNVSLEFSKFNIAETDVLSIYTDKELTDSITSAQNNLNNIWATRVYQGNVLNIVLKTSSGKKSSIFISKVNFGYKKFGAAQYGNPGTSAFCNVNVACPDGNGWGDEANSVALIVANGQESCTGTLLMNTCNTDRPFLLTADHCLQAGDVNNWVFQFQYWSTACNTNTGMTEDIQFNGCQLRANHSGTDFALLELNNTPAQNSGIRYAGWSRLTPANGSLITSTTMLHHPRGDVMKVSRDLQAPIQTTFSGIQCWQLSLDIGATEGGSSGAAYFNQNHRVIGQHYGIPNVNLPTCDNHVKVGGRFDLSWTGGGTNSTRLSNWLDPSNSGAMTTNTTNVSGLSLHPIASSFLPVTGNNVVCGSSETYSITGVLPGASVVWTLYGPDANGFTLPLQNVCSLSSSGSQATLTKINNGTVRLGATITNCDGTIQYAQKTVTFGVPEIYSYGAYMPDNLGTSYTTLDVNGTATFTPAILNYVTLESSGNNSYTWSYDGGSSNAYYYFGYTGPSFAYLGWNTPVAPYNYMGFTLYTTNACGTRNDPLYFYYDGPYQYRIFPNPVRSNFTIQSTNTGKDKIIAGKKIDNGEIQRVQILNKRGDVVLEMKLPGNSKQVNISIGDLKPDIYLIKIYGKTRTEIQKIIITQ